MEETQKRESRGRSSSEAASLAKNYPRGDKEAIKIRSADKQLHLRHNSSSSSIAHQLTTVLRLIVAPEFKLLSWRAELDVLEMWRQIS